MYYFPLGTPAKHLSLTFTDQDLLFCLKLLNKFILPLGVHHLACTESMGESLTFKKMIELSQAIIFPFSLYGRTSLIKFGEEHLCKNTLPFHNFISLSFEVIFFGLIQKMRIFYLIIYFQLSFPTNLLLSFWL